MNWPTSLPLIVAVSSGAGGAYPVAELRMSSYKNSRICYIPEQIIIRDVENVLNEAGENIVKNPFSISLQLVKYSCDVSLMAASCIAVFGNQYTRRDRPRRHYAYRYNTSLALRLFTTKGTEVTEKRCVTTLCLGFGSCSILPPASMQVPVVKNAVWNTMRLITPTVHLYSY